MSTEGPSRIIQPGAVDWTEVRRRLESVNVALEHGWTSRPEERERVLRERAVALAKEPGRDVAGERIEIVEFLLAHERYGVESSYVREVWPLRDLTPLPCTPSFVLGIVNVRGQILSVVDLKKLFGLPDRGLGDLNKVLILKSDSMEFGILADSILGVRFVATASLQKSVPTITGVGEEYLRGITEDRLIVLNALRILSDKRLVVNEEVNE